MKRSILAGLILTAAITALFWVTDLDLELQSLAYRDTEPHWPFATRQPWLFLHDFGTLPGLLLALLAIIALGASFANAAAARWRYRSLYIFVLMALGPGLVTNVLGKVMCGRPRPDEILNFGGTFRFHRPFELGTPGQGFSFLCGHCSMGFLFLAFFFLLRGWKRWVALIGSVAFGLLIGAGRVIQAAHFPSDVLLDASVMFTLAAVLSPIASLTRVPRWTVSGWKAAVGTAVTIVVLIVGFLFSTPVHKEHVYRWIDDDQGRSSRPNETKLRWMSAYGVSIEVEKGTIHLDLADQVEPLRIHSLVHGYGIPGAGSQTEIGELDAILRLQQRLEGRYWEVHGSFGVSLPKSTPVRIALKTDQGKVYIGTAAMERPVSLSGSFDLVDPNHRFTREAGNRFIHPGRGPRLVVSVQADQVVVR